MNFDPSPKKTADGIFQAHISVGGDVGRKANEICAERNIKRTDFLRQCMEFALSHMPK